jgi:hypothetical protein
MNLTIEIPVTGFRLHCEEVDENYEISLRRLGTMVTVCLNECLKDTFDSIAFLAKEEDNDTITLDFRDDEDLVAYLSDYGEETFGYVRETAANIVQVIYESGCWHVPNGKLSEDVRRRTRAHLN